MRWIQQHDKFTNDLPGSIPVAPGVTVLLTKHLDRGSKSLLKGRRGTIDSVEPDPREPPIDPNDTERHRFRYLPKIVYVAGKVSHADARRGVLARKMVSFDT